MPDIVNLIIWLIAGVAGGNAAGELLKGDYDLGPGNTIAGAIGGVVGALILQTLIPDLEGHRLRPHHRPGDSSRRQRGRSDGHRRRCAGSPALRSYSAL